MAPSSSHAPAHLGPRLLRAGSEFDAVVFDMDGLMFDTERLYAIAMREVCGNLGYEAPDDLLHAMIGRAWPDSRRMMVERLGEAFPLSSFEAGADAWFSRHLELHGVPHKDGLLPLLEWLRSAGIRCAVATSTQNPRATHKLTRGGILHFFEHIVTGDQVRQGKPAPDIYLEALRRLDVPASRACALEDSPNGLRAASSAGLRTFLVPDLAPVPASVRDLAYSVCPDLHAVLGCMRPESGQCAHAVS